MKVLSLLATKVTILGDQHLHKHAASNIAATPKEYILFLLQFSKT
jgi:hypothetical protein